LIPKKGEDGISKKNKIGKEKIDLRAYAEFYQSRLLKKKNRGGGGGVNGVGVRLKREHVGRRRASLGSLRKIGEKGGERRGRQGPKMTTNKDCGNGSKRTNRSL